MVCLASTAAIVETCSLRSQSSLCGAQQSESFSEVYEKLMYVLGAHCKALHRAHDDMQERADETERKGNINKGGINFTLSIS